MKDIIDFPVVGGKYTPNFEWSKKIGIGSLLELVPDPGSEFDSYAIKVIQAGKWIGYVPNRGRSCTHCWSPIYSGDHYCSACGSGYEMITTGGLALRMHMIRLFDKNYAVTVTDVDPLDKENPVKVRLMYL